VSVQWNGVRLPILAISSGQINAQLPFDAVVGSGELKLTSDSISSAPIAASVKAAAPGLFQVSPGFVLAINEDGTLNSSSRPAPVGSVVVIYATGCGNYDAPVSTGNAVPVDRLYRLALANSLVIGGLTSEILFAGAAPALGTGLVQINARIPAVGPGEWAVTFLVGGVPSNAPHIFVSDADK